MKAHPYLELLRTREISVLWSGLALSALGSELYRVGAIWMAVNVAGTRGAYLASAQMAAILITSVCGGAVAERVSRRVLLVGSDLARAGISLLVVAAVLSPGLTLPTLMLTSVALAAFAALFDPVLQSSLPLLVQDRSRLRAANGLFDATARLAQVVGPSLAAALIMVIPVLHLLTVNALSFLASGLAIAIMGRRLGGQPEAQSASNTGPWGRLARGISTANGCPGAWPILLTTMLRGAAYALGFSVGVPLLFAGRLGAGDVWGFTGLALVFGACAGGELVGNVWVVTIKPRRPWRMLFLGYMTIGVGLSCIGLAQILVPVSWRVPAMIASALPIGFGGAFAGVQMLTFFGSRLSSDAFASVLRLRLTLITIAAMVTTAAGPWAFARLGIVACIVGCGVAVAAAACVSLFSKTHDRVEDGVVGPSLVARCGRL